MGRSTTRHAASDTSASEYFTMTSLPRVPARYRDNVSASPRYNLRHSNYGRAIGAQEFSTKRGAWNPAPYRRRGDGGTSKASSAEMLARDLGMARHAMPDQSRELLRVLREWDTGSRATRHRILRAFTLKHASATGPQLERDLGNGASLFLTRISAWLRLTYLLGVSLSLQLEAIAIFLRASAGPCYLIEFLEVGGVLTILEILTLDRIEEIDKQNAVQVLQLVAHAGRRFKELICEHDGVRTIVECLAGSSDTQTLECMRALLHDLGVGNPGNCSKIQDALLTAVPQCAHGSAQRVVAQTIGLLLPHTPPDSSYVAPILGLFKTLDFQVQYEGFELLLGLARFPDLCQQVVDDTSALLTPGLKALDNMETVQMYGEGKTPRSAAGTRPDTAGAGAADARGRGMTREPSQRVIPAVFPQQACACKAMGLLAQSSVQLARAIMTEATISGLLHAMANTAYYDSQRQARNALLVLCSLYPELRQDLRVALGREFSAQLLRSDGERCLTTLSEVRLSLLRQGIKLSHVLTAMAEADSLVLPDPGDDAAGQDAHGDGGDDDDGDDDSDADDDDEDDGEDDDDLDAHYDDDVGTQGVGARRQSAMTHRSSALEDTMDGAETRSKRTIATARTGPRGRAVETASVRGTAGSSPGQLVRNSSASTLQSFTTTTVGRRSMASSAGVSAGDSSAGGYRALAEAYVPTMGVGDSLSASGEVVSTRRDEFVGGEVVTKFVQNDSNEATSALAFKQQVGTAKEDPEMADVNNSPALRHLASVTAEPSETGIGAGAVLSSEAEEMLAVSPARPVAQRHATPPSNKRRASVLAASTQAAHKPAQVIRNKSAGMEAVGTTPADLMGLSPTSSASSSGVQQQQKQQQQQQQQQQEVTSTPPKRGPVVSLSSVVDAEAKKRRSSSISLIDAAVLQRTQSAVSLHSLRSSGSTALLGTKALRRAESIRSTHSTHSGHSARSAGASSVDVVGKAVCDDKDSSDSDTN